MGATKKIGNKKGFTLVELLVGFAIFGALSLAIAGLITMSARSYRRTSAMINLQIEYQVMMTVLSEYIIDCDTRITYDSAEHELFVVNNGDTNVFRYDEGESVLYLDEEVLSRNVSGFSVSFENSNMIEITMAFSSLDRVYTASQLTALRNTPLLENI